MYVYIYCMSLIDLYTNLQLLVLPTFYWPQTTRTSILYKYPKTQMLWLSTGCDGSDPANSCGIDGGHGHGQDHVLRGGWVGRLLVTGNVAAMMVMSSQVLFWINTVLFVLRKMGLITLCFASCIMICKSWNTSMQFWWQFLDPTKEPATPDYDNVPSALPSDWVDGLRSHPPQKSQGTWRECHGKLHIFTLLGTNISHQRYDWRWFSFS